MATKYVIFLVAFALCAPAILGKPAPENSLQVQPGVIMVSPPKNHDSSSEEVTQNPLTLPAKPPSSSSAVNPAIHLEEVHEIHDDASAVPLRPTANCPRLYIPVCASNGLTYNTKCEFEAAQKVDSNLTLVKSEAC